MDLTKVLVELHARRAAVEQAIAQLEEMLEMANTTRPPSKRGRRGMGSAERDVVSKRMKNYWAKWREQKGKPSPGAAGEDRLQSPESLAQIAEGLKDAADIHLSDSPSI